jgi:dTMP kinase
MYITIDGPEASGKSTLIANIASKLREHGFSVYTTKEPGSDNEFCQKMREIVLHSACEIDRGAEFLAFMADRKQHLSKVVAHEERMGNIILSDRSMLSGAVYAAASGLDSEYIEKIVEASGIRVPDMSIITTASADFSAHILERRSLDRIERRPADYHIKVDGLFADMPFDFSKRWNLFRMPSTDSLTKEQAMDLAVERIWTLF